jgi:hypothetical protein
MAGFGKPLMIAEFGSLNVGGDRAEWYGSAMNQIASKEPAVKAVLFFNKKDDQTVTSQRIDWTVDGDSLLVKTISAGIRRLERPGTK